MATNKCQYCSKEYNNKYLLNRHVKSSVRCIKARGITDEHIFEHACPCGYSTSRADNLTRHQELCSFPNMIRTLAERDSILKDRDKTIEDRNKTIEEHVKTIEDHVKMIFTDSKTIIELKEQVKLLMTRPIINNHSHNHTTNNNSGPTYNMSYYKQHIQDNFESITQHLLQRVMNQITIVDISCGGAGLAKFVKKHLDHQHLLILDQARRKGAYKDANGQVVVDAKLRSLLQMIGEAGYPPAKKIFIDWNSENPDSFLNSSKSKTLTSLMGATGWLNRVGEGKTDEDDSEILSSFVDELASGYTKEALHNHLDRQREPPLIHEEPEKPTDETKRLTGYDSDVSSDWPDIYEEPDRDEIIDDLGEEYEIRDDIGEEYEIRDDLGEEYETDIETASMTSSQFDAVIGIKNYETCRARGTRDEDNLYRNFKPTRKCAIMN
jgi:hypothetical protein